MEDVEEGGEVIGSVVRVIDCEDDVVEGVRVLQKLFPVDDGDFLSWIAECAATECA